MPPKKGESLMDLIVAGKKPRINIISSELETNSQRSFELATGAKGIRDKTTQRQIMKSFGIKNDDGNEGLTASQQEARKKKRFKDEWNTATHEAKEEMRKG